MKRHVSIGLYMFVLAMLMACNRPDDALVETRHGTSQIEQVPEPAVPEAPRRVEGPSLALSAIDSLMWRQPDSALTLLLPYFDTCCRDALNASLNVPHGNSMETHAMRLYNGHYAHLLLSELLYKNDYKQTNRRDLQKAVCYFDSLCCRDVARRVSTDPTIAFFTARAHYINGVGYYERDSLVEACKEYLKVLEVMENHFEKKDLVGTKAKFMAYTYNRLGDLFSEQYILDPAIDCYRCSYDYSVISPISSYSVSIALYRIGKQHDMKGDKDSADYYYSRALANMPDSTNLYYKDIVCTKTLLSYQLTHQAEASLKRLKQMALLADDDDERLTRYLLIGGIFFEENLYDSALLYLEPVFENKENQLLQIRVANYLRIIHDSLGNKEKSNECMNYLALNNEIGAENSALVSQLSNLYKMYMSQKQEKEAGIKREAAIEKTLGIIIPIAFVLALLILVMAKLRSKKLLRQQQEEAERKLGEAEQQHRMEQAALSGRLKKSNEEVRELKGQIKRLDELEAAPKQAESFTEEPICRLILERVKNGQFLSQIDCNIYKDNALSKEQIVSLREAADLHFGLFTLRLAKAYPQLTQNDLDYCCLYLLGLSDADVSALMQKAYPTVSQRSRKIKAILGNDSPLPLTLRSIANN